jgi:hypothetical protein
MKFVWFNQTILLAVFVLAMTACKKRGDQYVPVPDNTHAGKGGNATFKITAQHAGVDIDSCEVFLKYNSSIPPNGPYDDSAWCTISDQKPPVVTFPGLRKGDYFIYIKGWDLFKSQTVYGSRFYTITTDTTATYTLIVPVN